MKIFLSHKSSDSTHVEAIVNAFKQSSKRLHVFVSPSIENAGSDWRDRIWAELRDSHCVLLLYTDERLQWDWSLYECGFFHGHHHHRNQRSSRRLNDSEAFTGRRLFIIHRKAVKRPKPLEKWDSIAVDTKASDLVDLTNLTPLQKFLDRLFFKKSFGLTQPLLDETGEAKEDQIARLSKPLINALKGYAQPPHKKAPLFAIEIPGAKWPGNGELPEGTMISSRDPRALEALGVEPQGRRGVRRRMPWLNVRAALEQRLGNAWPYWSRALADTLRDIQKERYVCSALPLLRKGDGRQGTWRPVLDETSRDRAGIWVFTILLADIAPAIERLPRDDLGKVTRFLSMERMFTRGIIEEYGPRFGKMRAAEEVGTRAWFSLISEFRRAIDVVYAEAMNMGYDREEVAEVLARGGKETIYRETIREWKSCEELIGRFANERDSQRSWDICRSLFNKLQSMASDMYRIASQQLANLTAEIPHSLFPADGDGASLAPASRRVAQLPIEIVDEYKKRFKEARDRGEIVTDAWFDLISEFRRAIELANAEATNLGDDREEPTDAIAQRQRRAFRKTIEEWKKCEPLIEEFADERKPERAWELCYDLLNDMRRIANKMYRTASN